MLVKYGRKADLVRRFVRALPYGTTQLYKSPIIFYPVSRLPYRKLPSPKRDSNRLLSYSKVICPAMPDDVSNCESIVAHAFAACKRWWAQVPKGRLSTAGRQRAVLRTHSTKLAIRLNRSLHRPYHQRQQFVRMHIDQHGIIFGFERFEFLALKIHCFRTLRR